MIEYILMSVKDSRFGDKRFFPVVSSKYVAEYDNCVFDLVQNCGVVLEGDIISVGFTYVVDFAVGFCNVIRDIQFPIVSFDYRISKFAGRNIDNLMDFKNWLSDYLDLSIKYGVCWRYNYLLTINGKHVFLRSMYVKRLSC